MQNYALHAPATPAYFLRVPDWLSAAATLGYGHKLRSQTPRLHVYRFRITSGLNVVPQMAFHCPISSGSNTEPSYEEAPQGLPILEACGEGNTFDCQFTRFQLELRRLKTKVLNVLRRCEANLARKDPCKIAWAHSRTPGEILDRQILLQILR